MATVECDAALSADSSVSSDMVAVYAMSSGLSADSSVSPDMTAVFAMASGLIADSSASPNMTAVFGADADLTADSALGLAIRMLYSATAAPLAGSGLAGSFIEEESLTALMAGTSVFSCLGFEKVHRVTPPPNPAGRTVPVLPRVALSAPAAPSYSVGSGTGRARTGPAVQTPIRRRGR